MERLDIKISYENGFPFKIDAFQAASNATRRLVQLIVYYSTLQKGEDPIHPELGIDFGMLNNDVFYIKNEYENLVYNFRQRGYDITLKQLRKIGNTLEITYNIEGYGDVHIELDTGELLNHA